MPSFLLLTIPVASSVIVGSAVLVLSCGQTDRQTDAAKRFTPATVVGVGNICLGKNASLENTLLMLV